MGTKNFDFSGYATVNNILCSDGRVIRKNAFKDNDGERVPLVWGHDRATPDNILGHAVLENRDDGVYAFGFLNDTEPAKHAKELLRHGDIDSLSIYANRLMQNGNEVIHGNIVEVSLVLSGANPGARIDNITLQHSDGGYEELDEAIISFGKDLNMKNTEDQEQPEVIEHKDAEENTDDPTIADIWNSLTDEQRAVAEYIIAKAVAEAGNDSNDNNNDNTDEEDNMTHSNVFEGDTMTGSEETNDLRSLAHSAFSEAVTEAKTRSLHSLRDSFLEHAGTYGIDAIDVLFPDAQQVGEPQWIKRNDDWVTGVVNGAHHSPFSRIKTVSADITEDAARARGYIKGNLKKEEVFKLLKRATTPTTIYKKQKLDRDDIVDITDLDVVAWMKGEMRGMLNEEIGRAVLVGDGRDSSSEDKVNEDNVRPIWTDAELYTKRVQVESTTTDEELVKTIVRSLDDYEGTGTPALYTTRSVITNLLLLEDKMGRRLYNTRSELADALGVSEIVDVPVMKGLHRTDSVAGEVDLIGIIVNIKDYTIGADKGGEVNLFDDFDIDYNQYKYLLETRISGALTKVHSAVAIERKRA